MKKLRWLSLLMAITILGITGFQLYWLRENYSREKKALDVKTQLSFRETVLHVQASKLKLDLHYRDSIPGSGVRVFVSNDKEPVRFNFTPREEIISTINVLRDKLDDSLKHRIKSGMVVSMNKSSMTTSDTSINITSDGLAVPGHGNYVINMLYGVDSLQDSIRVVDIDTAYRTSLKEQGLNIPFTIQKIEGRGKKGPAFDEVTIGFAKPVTYKLQLGNTFSYLLKRIIAPIIFSLLLLGITILSFVLLYKNLLRQQRLAALKNEFISNITHELKTPIATVGVAIEALKSFNAIQDPLRTKEYLDISANELQRLSLLVDKVLKLSMFEKKEIELKYESLNLKDVIDEVTGSLRLQFEKYHARVNVITEGNLEMRGDKLHLQSVVFNLLDNALKYGKNEPSIQIELKEKEDNIIMSVTDNGIGIPAEYKEKIFDKFFRVPHGDTHNAKGYGLGLSYVAHVIQKHHGLVTIESQADIGTKFIITLPKQNS